MTPGETLSGLFRRIRFFLLRDRKTHELAQEMHTHLEYRAESLQRNGEAESAAHYEARKRFGNVLTFQEVSQDMWGFGSLELMRRDLRHAIRRMRRRPAVSLAVVIVMALGIGATTAMFSAVDAAMLRPLPFANASELVTLRTIGLPSAMRYQGTAEPVHNIDFVQARAMRDLFSNVAVYASGGLNLVDAQRPLRLQTGVVTPSFFATLGVTPERGRAFDDNDGKIGAAPVVILSHALWTNHFGGRDILGTNVQLNGKAYQVVGVMRKNFSFPNTSDIWIPFSIPITEATFEAFRGYLATTTVARLAPGVTDEFASTQMLTRWTQALSADKRPERKERITEQLNELRTEGTVTLLQRELVGDRRTALLVLLGATGLLLLIACANVTNLLLSQAAMRQREIAVRAVLGASRSHIVRQLLIESMLLAVCGALLGLLLAPLALKALTILTPTKLVGLAPPQLDVRVLLFATGMALLTGIGFGLWPALGGTKNALGATIKSGSGHGATARTMGRARNLLVGAEVAMTIMLLIGAGLMLRSFQHLMGLDSGLKTDRIATLEMSFPSAGTPLAVRQQKLQDILARLAVTPGIEAAAVVNDIPLGSGGMAIMIEADGEAAPKGQAFTRYLTASRDYFKIFGIPILRGNTFDPVSDSLAPHVAVINMAMANKYWANGAALGRTFHFNGDTARYNVIGIVADVRSDGLDEKPLPQMYFPITQSTPNTVSLLARGQLPPAALQSRLAEAVHAVDPTQAVYKMRMMDEVVSGSVAPRRANTVLISAFAALAFLLAGLGVYAVVDYGVAQRTREFGIRSALGASGRDLLRLVASDMMLVVGVGIVVGLIGAWVFARVLESLLYEIQTHDVTTFVVVPILLAACALFAALWPARRAMRVNPAEVMRAD